MIIYIIKYKDTVSKLKKNRWIHAFPSALEQSEIQAALSKIWALITNSVSYDAKHVIII